MEQWSSWGFISHPSGSFYMRNSFGGIDIAVAGSSNLAQVKCKCEVRVVTRPSLGCFFDVRPPEWFLPRGEFQLDHLTPQSGGLRSFFWWHWHQHWAGLVPFGWGRSRACLVRCSFRFFWGWSRGGPVRLSEVCEGPGQLRRSGGCKSPSRLQKVRCSCRRVRPGPAQSREGPARFARARLGCKKVRGCHYGPSAGGPPGAAGSGSFAEGLAEVPDTVAGGSGSTSRTVAGGFGSVVGGAWGLNSGGLLGAIGDSRAVLAAF